MALLRDYLEQFVEKYKSNPKQTAFVLTRPKQKKKMPRR
jgi:hypothetical protein